MDVAEQVFDLMKWMYRRHQLMKRNSAACDALVDRVLVVETTLRNLVEGKFLMQDASLAPVLQRLVGIIRRGVVLLDEVGELGPIDRAWYANKIHLALETLFNDLSAAQTDLLVPLQVVATGNVVQEIRSIETIIRREFSAQSHLIYTESSSLNAPLQTTVPPEVCWDRFAALNETKFSFLPFFLDRDIVNLNDRKFEDRFTPIGVAAASSASLPAAGEHPNPVSSSGADAAADDVVEFDGIAAAWAHAVSRHQTHVLIEAPAGSGKTTLMKWIARNPSSMIADSTVLDALTQKLLTSDSLSASFGSDASLGLSDSTATFEAPFESACLAVVVIDLSRLERYLLETPSVTSVNSLRVLLQSPAFQSATGHQLFAPSELDSVSATLLQNRENILYLFDGYDEVQYTSNRALRLFLASLHTAVHCDERLASGAAHSNSECTSSQDNFVKRTMKNVIVTTRPERSGCFSVSGGLESEMGELVEFNGYCIFRLLPWSEAACDSYIERFPQLRRSERTFALELLASEYFDTLERLPFAVHLVCCALLMAQQNGDDKSVADNNKDGSPGSAVCPLKCSTHVFDVIVDKVLSKKVLERGGSASDASRLVSTVRSEVQLLAFQAVCRSQSTITFATEEQATRLGMCGLLELVAAPRHYRFLHKTLMEYLAARHIYASSSVSNALAALTQNCTVTLFFLADIARSRVEAAQNRSLHLDPSDKLSASAALRQAQGVWSELAECVANRFAMESVPLIERIDAQLMSSDRCYRRAVTEKYGVTTVLIFFVTLAVRPPVSSRDRNDLDGTRSAMKILLDRLPGSTTGRLLQPLPAAARRAAAHNWSVLFIEPSARLGALYVLNRLCAHCGHVVWMKQAALEAATSRRGIATLTYLIKYHGVRLSLDEAVAALHIDAVRVLLERLSTVLNAEKGLVIEDGAVVCDGALLSPKRGWWNTLVSLRRRGVLQHQRSEESRTRRARAMSVVSRAPQLANNESLSCPLMIARDVLSHLFQHDVWQSVALEIVTATHTFPTALFHTLTGSLLHSAAVLPLRRRLSSLEIAALLSTMNWQCESPSELDSQSVAAARLAIHQRFPAVTDVLVYLCPCCVDSDAWWLNEALHSVTLEVLPITAERIQFSVCSSCFSQTLPSALLVVDKALQLQTWSLRVMRQKNVCRTIAACEAEDLQSVVTLSEWAQTRFSGVSCDAQVPDFVIPSSLHRGAACMVVRRDTPSVPQALSSASARHLDVRGSAVTITSDGALVLPGAASIVPLPMSKTVSLDISGMPVSWYTLDTLSSILSEQVPILRVVFATDVQASCDGSSPRQKAKSSHMECTCDNAGVLAAALGRSCGTCLIQVLCVDWRLITRRIGSVAPLLTTLSIVVPLGHSSEDMFSELGHELRHLRRLHVAVDVAEKVPLSCLRLGRGYFSNVTELALHGFDCSALSTFLGLPSLQSIESLWLSELQRCGFLKLMCIVHAFKKLSRLSIAGGDKKDSQRVLRVLSSSASREATHLRWVHFEPYSLEEERQIFNPAAAEHSSSQSSSSESDDGVNRRCHANVESSPTQVPLHAALADIEIELLECGPFWPRISAADCQ